ncbi:MAG: acyl-CoA desaturase [Nitrospinales bacterium]
MSKAPELSIPARLPLNKGTIAFFIFLHAGALLALFPFAFSWGAVALFFFLHWLTASVGICFAFHRYLTHRSFELPRWLAYFTVFCGTLACENGPIKWVGQHRMHHGGSDTEKDPHSARKGFWWAHLGWMLHVHPQFDDKAHIDNFSKDLTTDPFYQFLDKHFIAIQVVFGLFLLALGGVPFVVWGVFLRLVMVYHTTWFVNSAAHWFGYKNFQISEVDKSTNCWWVGLIAYGEGWHNNHHAFPKSARHGLRPWEIDLTWMLICTFKKLGLLKNIRVAQLLSKAADSTEANPSTAFEGRIIKEAA